METDTQNPTAANDMVAEQTLDTESAMESVENTSAELVRKYGTPKDAALALVKELFEIKEQHAGQSSLKPADDVGTQIVNTFKALNQEVPQTVLDAMVTDGHIVRDYGPWGSIQSQMKDEIWTLLGDGMLQGKKARKARAASGDSPAKPNFLQTSEKSGKSYHDIAVEAITGGVGTNLKEGQHFNVKGIDAQGIVTVTVRKPDGYDVDYSGQYPGSLSWKVKEVFGLVKKSAPAPKAE